MSARTPRILTGRHVLALILGFFALVFAVNGAFVYLANESWTGLTSDQAYREGLTYNGKLATAAASRALGWRAGVEIEPDEGGQSLAVALVDRAGRPLDGLQVRARFRRPVIEGHDRDYALDPVGAGRYRAVIDLEFKGQWDVTVTAEAADGRRFRQDDRLWLK